MENPFIIVNERSNFLIFSVLTVPISQGLFAWCLVSQSMKIIQQPYNCLLSLHTFFQVSGGIGDKVCAHGSLFCKFYGGGQNIFVAKSNRTQALMCNVVKGQIRYYYIRTSTLKLQDAKSKSKKKQNIFKLMVTQLLCQVRAKQIKYRA